MTTVRDAQPDPDARHPTRHRATRREVTVAAIVLAVLVVALAVVSWNRVTGPFGNSDEGLDSSVWAMCTRALRDDPIGSALGGRRTDGVSYANHPPLLCLTGAATETLAGEEEWATRAPAWLATLALVPLTYLMLRRLRFEPFLATAGTLVGLGTPMIVTYGTMLDTPVVALPFAAAVAASLAGEWAAGDDPPRPWPVAGTAALALLAGLAGWQAGLLALLGGAAVGLWGPTRSRAIPYLAGAVVGLGLSLAWAAWTYGTLTDLVDKLSYRSGGTIGLADSLSFQLDWIRILLGASTLGLVACAAAVTDRAVRPLALLLLATAATWSVVLHGGAGGHQFWNYFTVLPAALGGAWALGALARQVDRSGSLPVRGPTLALGLAAALAVLQVTGTTLGERLIDDGLAAGTALEELDVPDGATELAVVGDEVRVYAIVAYYTGLVPRDVPDRADLEAIAAADPTRPVLVVRPCSGEQPDALCRQLPDPDSDRTELVPAGELVAQLG